MTVLLRDLWTPIWPNLAASALRAPAALTWHHSRMRRHISAEIERLHDDMTAPGPDKKEPAGD